MYLMINSPYYEGNTLDLRIIECKERYVPYIEEAKPIIRAHIVKVIRPMTCSVVLQVRLTPFENDEVSSDEETYRKKPVPPSERFILKLHDRRFSTELRETVKSGPWTPTLEQELKAYVLNSMPHEFLATINDGLVDRNRWNEAQRELFLADECRNLHSTEVATYDRLISLQKYCVPALYADVRLADGDIHEPETATNPSTLITDKEQTSYADWSQICGILIEEIDGFALSDLATSAPEKDWFDVLYAAKQWLKDIDRCGVLNKNVRPANVIMQGISLFGDDFWNPVFIDFTQCELREENTTEEEWRKRQIGQDEEGAIGYVMNKRLMDAKYETKKNQGFEGNPFPWEYKPSDPYSRN
ncbi:hypothetical protein MMC17_008520 [Xylographa soralifera]|nr:hypothetical protein [Xylographa soralifera]